MHIDTFMPGECLTQNACALPPPVAMATTSPWGGREKEVTDIYPIRKDELVSLGGDVTK